MLIGNKIGALIESAVFDPFIDFVHVERLKDFPECGDSIRIYHICEGCLKKAIILGRGEFEKEAGFHVV